MASTCNATSTMHQHVSKFACSRVAARLFLFSRPRFAFSVSACPRRGVTCVAVGDVSTIRGAHHRLIHSWASGSLPPGWLITLEQCKLNRGMDVQKHVEAIQAIVMVP